MGVNKLNSPSEVFRKANLYHEIVDHFDHFTDGNRFTQVLSDSGSASVGDAQGGLLSLVASDGTAADNDEAYLKSTNEIFKFDASRPIRVEALLQFSEANTDDANVIFGLMNAAGANSLLDDGGGPAADDSSALIYKVDGETVWRCETSNGADSSTQEISVTDENAGGSAYQLLAIEVVPGKNSGEVDVYFFIDTKQARKSGSGVPSQRLIVHENLSVSGAEEMNLVLGVKNGGANLETLNVKMVRAIQLY